MLITTDQIRTARQKLGLSLTQLAKAASMCPSTVSRLEAGLKTQKLSRLVVQRVLEERGAEFHQDGSVGVRDRQGLTLVGGWLIREQNELLETRFKPDQPNAP